jgi:hypothetical protein
MRKCCFKILLLPIVFAFFAYAQSMKPLVVYIGGAKSTPDNMKCWAASATRQQSNNYDFKAYPYPTDVTLNEGSDKDAGGINLIKQISAELSKESRPLIIVGHSSGSDLANALALKLHQQGKDVEHLYDLDGYGIPSNVAKLVPSTCVNAQGSGIHSPYWDKTYKENKCSGSEHKIMTFNDCGSAPWCLHFKMANTRAPSTINTSNYGSQGYSGCSANLDWLNSPAVGGKTNAVDPRGVR